MDKIMNEKLTDYQLFCQDLVLLDEEACEIIDRYTRSTTDFDYLEEHEARTRKEMQDLQDIHPPFWKKYRESNPNPYDNFTNKIDYFTNVYKEILEGLKETTKRLEEDDYTGITERNALIINKPEYERRKKRIEQLLIRLNKPENVTSISTKLKQRKKKKEINIKLTRTKQDNLINLFKNNNNGPACA